VKAFSTYGPLKDAKLNGHPLFSEDAWDNCKTILENIQHGYYSDPPDISLYFTCGKDKYGLMWYQCIQGTNGIEGGVHQNIIWWFGAFNAAPDFAVELLHDYVLYHNLKVSTRALVKQLGANSLNPRLEHLIVQEQLMQGHLTCGHGITFQCLLIAHHPSH
jgi:hypothetical protein